MALFALEHGADSALFVNASGTITGNWLNLLGLSNVKRSLAVLRINAEKVLICSIKSKITSRSIAR